jgi:hypothetical protein
MAVTVLRFSVAASAAMVVTAARVKSSRVESEKSESADLQNVTHNHGRVACPVIASHFHAGHMVPDRHGRVERQFVSQGLMESGASPEAAQFQARIAAYASDDLHQEMRYNGKPTDPSGPKYLNIFTMNKADQCSRAQQTTTDAGYFCNTNTQFVQHGYSTTLRAPDNGLANKGFDHYMNLPGVMESVRGTKVMTVQGLGKLLAHVRKQNGDHSGDQSLNKNGGLSGSGMAKYHPSVTAASDYNPLSQWQALFAWSAFFDAFSKTSSGVVGIPEADLRSLLVDGKFPARYQKKAWSLQSGLSVVSQLAGTGAGDEMARVAAGLLAQLGPNGKESDYMMGLLGALAKMGIARDDVYNSRQDAIRMLSTDA